MAEASVALGQDANELHMESADRGIPPGDGEEGASKLVDAPLAVHFATLYQAAQLLHDTSRFRDPLSLGLTFHPFEIGRGEPKGHAVQELMQLIVTIAGQEIVALSPNPPKDTDGRREDSGRGWVRELQGRWPGVLG